MHPDAMVQPGHGPAEPLTQIRRRTPGSVRRTLSIDIVRPDGFAGDIQLIGRGRELATGSDGRGTLAESAELEVEAEFTRARPIKAIRSTPAVAGLEGIVGQPTLGGFRGRLAAAVDEPSRTLVLHLIDDIPGTCLIAGQAQMAERETPGTPAIPILLAPDVCAGWRSDGTMVKSFNEGRMEVVRGPLAVGGMDEDDDPLAWHTMAPTHPTMMRRQRLIDVLPDDHGSWRVSSYLRDSHWPHSGLAAGRQTIIHEYLLEARVAEDFTVTDAVVMPRVLPWTECLGALGSAEQVIGRTIGDLDRLVRHDLRGPATCTHLNDVLRSLVGLPSMITSLPA